jgi:cysteine desulfurase family protein (TIGR01976 family)
VTATLPGTLAAAAPALDVARVRAAFPALERVHGGHPVAYFDGPGGTQVPRPVVDAMADYLYHHNANTHWAYPTSAETDALLLGARAAMADFLGGTPEEIAFGANMTTLTFHLARAIGRGVAGRPLGPGDEIVATELDHHANVAPWAALARERGVTVRVVRMDRARGCLDADDLARAIGPRTRVVAVGAASNALGTITDVARAAEMARAVGALTFVDAVHHAPHALVDVAALGCDFLACSAYKFYGPHVGVLWGRADRVAALDVPKLDPAPDVGAERLETGTQNHEGIVGAAAAVDFLASVGAAAEGASRRDRLRAAFASLHAAARPLVTRLWEGLSATDGVTVYGPPPDVPRTPTVSFTVHGVPSEAVATRLAERGVFVSHGDFYAATVAERLGATDGLVRAGCACYTTAEEVERLVEGVRALR